MTSLEERLALVSAIDDARQAGARLASACLEAALDVRTYQRWKAGDGLVLGDRRPGAPRSRPAHALTEAERQAIIAIQPYPTQAPQPLVLNQDAWISQTRDIKETGWQVSILAPRMLVDRSVQTVMAIGAGTLLVLILLAGLVMQRRRHYIDRIDFEARGRQDSCA